MDRTNRRPFGNPVLGRKMRKPLYKKLCSIASALIVSHPLCAIGYEGTAREYIIVHFVIGRCLAEEGYLTKEQEVELHKKALEKAGISVERATRIMKDEDLPKTVDNKIISRGGCRKIADEFRRNLK